MSAEPRPGPLPPTRRWALGRRLLAQAWHRAASLGPAEWTASADTDPAAEFAAVAAVVARLGPLRLNEHVYRAVATPAGPRLARRRLTWAELAAPYDAAAPHYDAAFRAPEDLAENAAVIARLGDVARASVLDVGCGTGLLLDYARPRRYRGLDPSPGMLARLRAKHPDAPVLCCPLEAFVPPPADGDGYDLVVALFGSANYIAARELAALPRLVRPGGRWLVMLWPEGYEPVTYARTGMRARPPSRAGDVAALPGRRARLGPWILVEGRR